MEAWVGASRAKHLRRLPAMVKVAFPNLLGW